MKDLTKIKTPLGLLGKKTRKALRAHHEAGGEIQQYITYAGWVDIPAPHWDPATAYRAKPQAMTDDIADGTFRVYATESALPVEDGTRCKNCTNSHAKEKIGSYTEVTTDKLHEIPATLPAMMPRAPSGDMIAKINMCPPVSGDPWPVIKEWQESRKSAGLGQKGQERLRIAGDAIMALKVPE